MNKVLGFILTLGLFACADKSVLEITVANVSATDRTSEIVELPLSDITARIADEAFVITDKAGRQIPYQKTFDDKVIFPVTITAGGRGVYTVKRGTPEVYNVLVFGKHYPERVDDIAWENDRIAFRTYGPALQATGEKAYGYDIWVKRVPELVVQERYRKELQDGISYHRDNGNGLDYYKVGPTLGAGTSALLVDETLVYPYCYKTFEILDNGPLRFTVKLVYNPLTIKGNDNVVETRLLSLDAGSQLNKVTISYTNLTEMLPVAAGIVMHDSGKDYVADAVNGYIAYAEPLEEPNGQIFVGAVFPAGLKDAKPVYLSAGEKRERGADGHLLAIADYQPGTAYTYYFGAGWNKWGFEDSAVWFDYVKAFAKNLREPLTVSIK